MNKAQRKRMFRMLQSAFDLLLTKISAVKDSYSAMQAINSSGSPIKNRTRLAAALRYLAGGSYLDITFAFRILKTSFYEIVFQIYEAV